MSNTCVHYEHRYGATPEAIYRAWTDREKWLEWWGPQGFSIPECTVDARKGGAYRCTMRSPDGTEHTVTGVFEHIHPQHIAMTWGWEIDGERGHESTVEVQIAPSGDGAVMVFDHCGFEDEAARKSHEEGWLSSFEKLGPALHD